MSNLTRIAWRNLWQHKIRTFVAGTVLFIGAVLLLAGQSLSGSIGSSMKRMVTRSLTGDIVLLSTRNESQINLFDFKNRETITNSDAVIRAALKIPEISGAVKMGKGIALIERGEGKNPIPSFALGVDPVRYPKIFSQFRLLSGTAPKPGVKGIWLNETYAGLFLQGKFKPGDKVQISAPTRSGFMNATKLTLRGTFRLEGIEGMASFINIMDISTYRTTFGMTINAGILSARAKKAIQKNKDLLDGDFNPDRMMDTMVQDQSHFNKNENRQTIMPPTAKERADALKKSRALSEYIALKLHKDKNRADTIKKLNRIFHERKLGVRAYSWEETAGPMGKMILMLRIILFSLAIVIFAMLIIIIMNSMVMTAVERTYEVGTMRAVGASRGFVVRLFLTEALFLGGLFGGLGTAVSTLLLSAIPGIPAGSQITRMIFGGEMLRIQLPATDIATTFLLILIVAATSSAYPAWIASRFKPVEAMNSK